MIVLQIVTEAAKMRYRSGSAFDCGGLTVRAPYGALRCPTVLVPYSFPHVSGNRPHLSSN